VPLSDFGAGMVICPKSSKAIHLMFIRKSDSTDIFKISILRMHVKLEMWANAQRDGCPAEYRWRPLFNAAV